MPGTLSVWLADRRVGTITNIPGDYNIFVFDSAYAEDSRRPVLSQSLIGASGAPRRVVPRTHRVAPPFFANLLPEADTVLQSLLARHNGINRTRDFPFLAALGPDLPGAVVIRTEQGEASEDQRSAEMDETVPESRPLQFSLAGVQIKFSAGSFAERLTIPVRGIGGSWIVKLPTNAWPRLPENEFAMMSLAERIGLDVPPIRLVELDDVGGLPADLPVLRSEEPRVAYAIERFDRTGDQTRLHTEDLNQVANQSPAEKYENKPMHWVAGVIATLCPVEDADELVRRLVFGICIGNNDMHLKNWSLIYPDGRNARLAPMYDYVCTRRYYPTAGLALTVGGQRAFEAIDKASLRTFAERAELSPKRTVIVANETVERLKDVWTAFKDEIPERELVEALERQFAAVPLMRGN
ncbi:MAG TPA: HipA domain-containing protein [Candidatus Limnocylindrales bacterium]|nr:HipA domain-containing protein [Candidatus Limnocylindrales bacterium]